jgi:dipeptidyl aminopeptidase/acylaminoacyl peptidase
MDASNEQGTNGGNGQNRPFSEIPAWEQRFRAPLQMFPRWAREAPERLTIVSNESGSYQVYAWDRARGTRRQVTDHPIGVTDARPTPDGEGVVWFHDETGSEVGRWVMEPFHGDARVRRALLEDVPDGWSTGLALGDGVVAAGVAGDDGFTVWVARGGDAARPIHSHEQVVHVADLSRDGSLLALEHSEHGDNIHMALRVLNLETGEVAGEQWDGPKLGLTVAGWSPVGGDQRLAFVHEREGLERPGVWDLTTGERRDLAVDLPGDVSVAGWWPDASALLILHDHEGRNELYRLALGGSEDVDGARRPERIEHPDGTIANAGVRPDGTVWYQISSGAWPPATRDAASGQIDNLPDGLRAPTGQPYRSWWFTNKHGDRIHGFLATPPTEGPFATVMYVHGGPTWAYTDMFMPAVQAFVDHGYAVAMVNYRGSTGYGIPFRDALIGDPGFPECEDVLAGLDDLIASGVADPDRAVIAGGSWGGYVTLLSIGLYPDRYAAADALVPVADYVAAYEDESAELRAFDRSLFLGTPEDRRDLYVERSPLTYIDEVRTPLLIVAGDNDSRCPIRQILNYIDALEARSIPHQVYRFEAGHGSLVVDERVRQIAVQLAFLGRHVPSSQAGGPSDGPGTAASEASPNAAR